MSLYENNAFCLLDLPGDADLKDIQIALKNLENRAEFGRTLDYEHVPFFIKNFLSDALKLSNRPGIEGRGYPLRLHRQISEIIFKPAERLRERAFWFDSFQGVFLPDLKVLALKDVTGPLSNWQGLLLKESTQPFSSPTAVAAAHNLAVYLHAFCLLCDPKAKKEKEWQRALTLWKGCIENETFWERLYDLEAGCGGEIAGGQDIINLRKNIAGILLQQNADLAEKALQQGDYHTAFRHYKIIETSGFPPGEIDRQLKQIIDFLIDQIELSCKVTKEDLEELSGETGEETVFDKKCQQIYHRFSLRSVPAVKFLEKCLPADDDRTLSARQELSLCLREISIALNNRVKNYSKATEIITEAVELAQGTGVWHKLGNDFKIMLSNLCYNVTEELEEAVDDAENAVVAGNACTTAFGRFLAEIFPAYDKFVKLWQEDESTINEIKSAMVKCLRSIYLHYYNDAHDYGQTERVLLRAKEIAGDSPASLLIEEDYPLIELLKQWRAAEACAAKRGLRLEPGSPLTHYLLRADLSKLESGSKTEETISQVRPWVRYWARNIDYILFSLVAGFILTIIAPSSSSLVVEDGLEIFLNMLLLFIWVFVEASLLSTWGTTPGKWLLRTTLRDSAGSKLTFSRALDRSFSVWWRGMGIGFPIVTLITLIVAYGKLTEEGITTWDQEGGFVVSHKKIGTLRTIVTILFFMGFFLLYVYASQN